MRKIFVISILLVALFEKSCAESDSDSEGDENAGIRAPLPVAPGGINPLESCETQIIIYENHIAELEKKLDQCGKDSKFVNTIMKEALTKVMKKFTDDIDSSNDDQEADGDEIENDLEDVDDFAI